MQKLMRHSEPEAYRAGLHVVDVGTLRREVGRLDLSRFLPGSYRKSETEPQARTWRRERKQKSRDSKDLDEVTPARFERATCGLGNGPEPQSSQPQNVSAELFTLKTEETDVSPCVTELP